MIKIRKFKEAVNKIQLDERSIAKIKQLGYDSRPFERDEDDILEAFELLYEVEYKYHMVKNKRFDGIEQRRKNILAILETTGENITYFLAQTFVDVFREWLANHAITNPEQWAKTRYYDGGDSLEEMFGFDEAMDMLKGELERYSSGYSTAELIKQAVEINPDILHESFLNDWVSDEYNMLIDELESDGLEEINDRFDKEFETEDEAIEFLDKYLSAYDEDYFEYMGSEEQAFEYVLEQLEETQFFENTDNIENFIDVDQFFLTAYEHILFPAWYGYWTQMGIDETRERVEDVYEQLLNIEKYPIEKQFMVLNIAKNTNHQNGSMMEYYEEMWGVDYVALEQLSSMDTREWDRELEEIGVRV